MLDLELIDCIRRLLKRTHSKQEFEKVKRYVNQLVLSKFANNLEARLIFESVTTNQRVWSNSWIAVRFDHKPIIPTNKARQAAATKSHDFLELVAWLVQKNLFWGNIEFEASKAAEEAFLAIDSWSDHSYLLQKSPAEVRQLALNGCHAAALILPASTALMSCQKLT